MNRDDHTATALQRLLRSIGFEWRKAEVRFLWGDQSYLVGTDAWRGSGFYYRARPTHHLRLLGQSAPKAAARIRVFRDRRQKPTRSIRELLLDWALCKLLPARFGDNDCNDCHDHAAPRGCA